MHKEIHKLSFPVNEHRLGRLKISTELIRNLSDVQLRLLSMEIGMVLNVQIDHFNLYHEYVIANPRFMKVKRGHEIPEYSLIVKLNENDKPIFEWGKVKDNEIKVLTIDS